MQREEDETLPFVRQDTNNEPLCTVIHCVIYICEASSGKTSPACLYLSLHYLAFYLWQTKLMIPRHSILDIAVPYTPYLCQTHPRYLSTFSANLKATTGDFHVSLKSIWVCDCQWYSSKACSSEVITQNHGTNRVFFFLTNKTRNSHILTVCKATIISE